MNEGIKPEIDDTVSSENFAAALEERKKQIVDRLVSANRQPGPGLVTTLEFLCATPSNEHHLARIALDQLQSSGFIQALNYSPDGSSDIFPAYELAKR